MEKIPLIEGGMGPTTLSYHGQCLWEVKKESLD